MKLLSILIFAGSMALSASTYSQKTKIDLQFENTSLTEILNSIEKSSEFIFIYNGKIVNSDLKRSISVKGETIEKVLNLLFQGVDVTYRIDDRQVFLYKKEELNNQELINGVIKGDQVTKKGIYGTVKDSKGLPLPGVTVVVKGTTIGTITDIEGQFRLSVPIDAKTIVFSFIGMKTQEIPLAGKTTFSLVLEEEIVGMEEVVVVGYGIQKKESVVGAISQVNNAPLMKSGSSNITNAIAGKLSGVLTMQKTGEPGANDATILIRGISSWNGSSPLVLVDGVERDFNALDPDEINTISVLKDASATAVYGAKGANGVIIVTTKRGKFGKPQLDFSASYGLQKATMVPDHISSFTTMSMLNVAKMNDGQFQSLTPQGILEEYRNPSTPLNSLRYPDVNYFDLLTRTFAPTTNANFNVTGGTNFVKYFCSLGYYSEGDFFKGKKEGFYDLGYNYKRFNYRTNVDFQLTKSATLSFNLGGETGIKNSRWNSWRTLNASSVALFPAYFPAWVLEQVPDPDYPNDKGIRLASALGDFNGNPYTSLNTGQFNRYIDSKLFTDLIFVQKLDFVTKGLSFTSKAALSTYYQNNILSASQTYPEYQLNYDDIGKPGVNPWIRAGQGNEYYQMAPLAIGVGGLQGNYYRDLYYEFGFNYANTFGKHSITGLALMNRSQKNNGTEFAYYDEALVGRATYNFSNKYLFEVNVGYTGSEQFAPGNRFGVFPSGAIGWVVSEEKFFKDAIPWVNKLKLRYSDGLTGSDAAPSRWLYFGGFYSDSRNYLWEAAIANSTAQWEEAHKRNLGLELGLFKNVLSFNIDFFDEQRDKIMLSPRTVTMVVGNSFKALNLGKMKKHGFELEVEFNKTTPAKFNYWAKGIFGFNENRIVFMDDLPYPPDYTKNAGKPLNTPLNGVQLTGTGYFTSVNDIHNNPSPLSISNLNVGDYKYLDYMVDGNITSQDMHPIAGNVYPPFTFSFSSGLSYKKFEFNFMFYGNLGKYVVYSETFDTEFIRGSERVQTSFLDYWTPVNPTSNRATLHNNGGATQSNVGWSSIWVEDRTYRKADYLRLKEVYAGYNMSSKFLNRHLSGVSNLLFFATANNLWTLTNLIEGDPEGMEFKNGVYPQMTSIKFGVKVAF
ncbi:MAG: TonB-dependent receptor [Bacteroidia bacterium]|nr:TonB-dependent receptor [Bacteroidia bacterium]